MTQSTTPGSYLEAMDPTRRDEPRDKDAIERIENDWGAPGWLHALSLSRGVRLSSTNPKPEKG